MTKPVISIVAGVIRDAQGRLLTVRKQGTTAFMLPGGKRHPGEDDATALARELAEELGCVLVDSRALGIFTAPAANEPDTQVEGAIYHATINGQVSAQAEIAELLWIDPALPPAVRLAPLLETQVLPRLF
ncbi:NUDIX domain-containing protein [Phenylobacterium sp.]|uniref:NUDIX hydrolase n=1 Tax=Phenylobacterium sp. TaxID=1871053 RepID=UPI00271D43B9|nr:NUDIX domain-containing protein [Phenylobacterium sp.]MDO8801095.1 NUDIX domain-containing protein [Phenylobacterium sp.]